MALRASVAVASAHLAAASVLYVPSFSPYPGYAGNFAVAGTMTITGAAGTDTTAKQSLQWKLTGLDTACTAGAGDNVTNGCGIHVHTGTSCATHGGVGGHYFSSALSDDPWGSVVYVAAANGGSYEHAGVEVTTGLSNDDILGRVMVVHELDSGKRIACGVIGDETGTGPTLAVPSFSPYPGYSGNLAVAGSMKIVGTSGNGSTAKQCLTWDLTGLDTACTAGAGDSVPNGCGVHVHTGTSCESAPSVGGHYYSAALSEDPWKPIVYVAAADGTSKQDSCIDVGTGLSTGDLLGRVMVVHELDSGKRIACGVLGVSAHEDKDKGATSAAISLGASLSSLLLLLAMGSWTL